MMFSIPNLFNIKPFIVSSGSMLPRFPVGSLIYVKKVDINELKIGDSITFYMDGQKVVATHEIYEIDKGNKLFRTQGINNKDQDGNIIHDANPVYFDNLIGKPILCIPYLGYVNKFITTSPGMYIVIVLTTLIIAISYLLDKKQRNEKRS